MGRRRGLATPRESFATAFFSDNGRLAVHRMRSRRLRGGNRSLPAGSSPGRPHPCRPTPTPSGLGAGRPRPSRAPPPPAPVGICRVLCFARFRHVGRWGCARGRIMESTEAAAPVGRGAGGASSLRGAAPVEAAPAELCTGRPLSWGQRRGASREGRSTVWSTKSGRATAGEGLPGRKPPGRRYPGRRAKGAPAAPRVLPRRWRASASGSPSFRARPVEPPSGVRATSRSSLP